MTNMRTSLYLVISLFLLAACSDDQDKQALDDETKPTKVQSVDIVASQLVVPSAEEAQVEHRSYHLKNIANTQTSPAMPLISGSKELKEPSDIPN